MMRLCCSCGHPIVAVARWDGHDFNISLHDETKQVDSDAIRACPHCGATLRLGSLKQHTPVNLDWFMSESDRSEEYAR